MSNSEAVRVYLQSLGCRLNEAELTSWARALQARGARVVARPQLADAMVLNTCAVTIEAARKSRKLISRLHRSNPAAKLVLTGCLASLQPAEVAELAGVDLVLGNQDKERLLDAVEQQLAADFDTISEPLEAAANAQTRTRAFVKVQDGCRNRCTFCIVTIARGNERSRPIAELIDEIQQLHSEGFQEVLLTGVHLGGYGSELGTDLVQLVEQVLQRTSVPRIRLSSLEPWDISPRLWPLWQDRRLCPHLHLPLQSGSDTILRRMARRCDVAGYLELVTRAREAIPDLVLTTDLIVGFPGESERAFEQSLQICERVAFAHVHIFPYSPRAGTAAARMDAQVDPSVKRTRSRRLADLAQKLRRSQQRRFVGSARPVLWEGTGEALPGRRRRWRGLTDNYLRVETVVPKGTILDNRITLARLDELTPDGRLVATLAGR